MGKRKDIAGGRFGYLTAIAPVGIDKHGSVIWECKCDCGNVHKAVTCALTGGHTQSCGCQHHPKKHGDSRKRLFSIHQGMKQRCYNQRDDSYPNYGGRGITICDEWLNSYEAFRDWALNNGYEDNLTIERTDNEKGYCPENCIWITRAEQNRNQRKTHHVYIDGEKVTLPMLAEAVGLSDANIVSRYSEGVRGLDLIRVANRAGQQISVEIDGIKYENLKRLSEKTGITRKTLSYRYRRGKRGNDLIAPPKRKKLIQNGNSEMSSRSIVVTNT